MLIDEAVKIFKYMSDTLSRYIHPDEDVVLEAATEHFKTEILDVDKFIKMNQCKEVSNPVFFNGPTPTEDGLLSNEIFGITKAERAGIYAYIDLGGDFMPPLIYKTLLKLNGKIADVVNGTDYFKIDAKGDLVPDPDGDTGIDWLKRRRMTHLLVINV